MKSRLLLCAASAASLGVSDMAAAQSAAGGDAAADDAIVVTARRVQESIQSVPLSVTAISQETLRRQKLTAVEDLQFVSPALTTSASLNRSTVNYNIRGQTQVGNGSLPSVQPYFNDVPLSVGTFQLYDLESVQVLKGPQGTLFGRNTTGGAILFYSRKPDQELDGYVQGSLGNLRARNLQAAVNVPLGSMLAIRIAGDITRRRGYTQNLTSGVDLDDQHVDSWRASLRFRPSDTIDNLLVYDSVYVNQHGAGSILSGYIPGKLAANTPGFIAAFNLQQALGVRQRYSNINLFDYRRGWGLSDTLSIDLGPITIKNIVGYRRNKTNAAYDSDGTGLAIGETTSNYLDYKQFDFHTISEEFQILGNTGRVKWIIGAYGDHTKSDRPNASVSQAFGTIARAVLTQQNDTSRALFGQADIGLDELAQGLKLTVGYRYTWDTRRLSSQIVNLLTNPPTPGVVLSDTARFSAPTRTFGLDWQVNPNLLLYVSSRRGYKSGGFNTLSAGGGSQQQFQPEYITDYEGGAKFDWNAGGMRGRFNLAAFTGDFTNIQRSVIVTATSTATINAAKARISGFELEASIHPTPALEISGFWSYIDASYKSYINPFSGADLSSAVFPYTPKHKLSGTVRWQLPLPQELARATLSGTVYRQTRAAYYDDNINFAPAYGAAYTIANFNLDIEDIAGKPLDMTFYIKNAFNKAYVSAGGLINSGIYGLGTVFYGEPRTYGVQLRYRFGASGK